MPITCSSFSMLRDKNLKSYYSCGKNICQKIQPAHTMITKRDFILRGNYLCEKYNKLLTLQMSIDLMKSASAYLPLSAS